MGSFPSLGYLLSNSVHPRMTACVGHLEYAACGWPDGVVDQDVQPTEGRRRPGEEPVTFVVPTEIGSERLHLTAGLRHLACRCLDARLGARRDTDPTVLCQQRLGNSPAEPSAGGGDQGALAPQAQLHKPMLEPILRQMPPFTTVRDTALAAIGPNLGTS